MITKPEHTQSQTSKLIEELKKGENSGFVDDFDGQSFLQSLHEKHVKVKR